MRKDKRKDDIHNYSFFLSFFLSFIWFDLRDWKKEIERLKEEKKKQWFERWWWENGKKKERQIKTIEKNQNLFHSFISNSNSNIWFQLWVDWFDWLLRWFEIHMRVRKNEKNQKSHFSL